MLINNAAEKVGEILLGKQHQIRLALCCLLSKGHLLIEDIPGLGKTTLSHALAQVLGLDYKRVQFTSDMLPSDILGVSIFDTNQGSFRFQKGPVFSQIVLADEINRANPKTQSALLEAMEEAQVSIEGNTYPLPQPFFVIATQNPRFQAGTFALPESQLDRFLMRITLGYPEPEFERKLFKGKNPREYIHEIPCLINADQLQEMQTQIKTIHCSEPLLDYLQRLIAWSRQQSDIVYGLSPRGAMALLSAAKTWAYMEGRDHVLPEDIQAVLPSVASHRLISTEGISGSILAERMLKQVPALN